MTTDPVGSRSSRTSFARRVWRAALLDADLYEEVEADRTALPQAALVVLVAALGFGIGSFSNGGWSGILWTTGVMILGWIGWAGLAYWIGAWLLPGPETVADHGELLRTLGFSAAPGVVAVLGLLPGLNPWLFLGVLLWMFSTMVVALRQALDYRSTARALAVCAIGIPFAIGLLAAVLLFTGPWPL
jgi:hypothetical protein